MTDCVAYFERLTTHGSHALTIAMGAIYQATVGPNDATHAFVGVLVCEESLAKKLHYGVSLRFVAAPFQGRQPLFNLLFIREFVVVRAAVPFPLVQFMQFPCDVRNETLQLTSCKDDGPDQPNVVAGAEGSSSCCGNWIHSAIGNRVCCGHIAAFHGHICPGIV